MPYPPQGFPLLDISNFKLGSASRDASGEQVISGLGFEPKVVIFIAIGGGSTYRSWSIGFTDGISRRCLRQWGETLDGEMTASHCLHCGLTVYDRMYDSAVSMDADGFTITWVLAGTYTINFEWLALK